MSLTGGKIAEFATNSMTLQISSSQALSLPNIECVVAENGVVTSASYILGSAYACTISNPVPQIARSVSVSLRYRSGGVTLSLTTSPATAYFITPTSLVFSSNGMNAQTLGSTMYLSVDVSLTNINASLFTSSRVFARLSDNTLISSTVTEGRAVFSYVCNHGSSMIHLTLDVNVNPSFLVNISLNALPITCISTLVYC